MGKFKKSYELTFRRVYGEESDAEVESIEKHWPKLCKNIGKFPPRDVWNENEFGPFLQKVTWLDAV